MPIEIVRYPEENAVYARLKETPYGGGKEIDDCRHVDVDLEDDTLGILFLYISDGVDLEDIPGITPSDKEALSLRLDQEGIKVKVAA